MVLGLAHGNIRQRASEMVCRDFVVYCVVFLKFSSLSRCFPNGAPLSACESMMPRHAGVVPQSNAAPYTVEPEASVFHPGKPVRVQILGPQYNGFLLVARRDGSSTPLGTWQIPPENTQLLQCFGIARSAVTHLDTSPRNNSVTFAWVPPDSACPTAVKFVATVAQSFQIYWLNVQSHPLTKAPGITCCGVKFFSTIGIIAALFLFSFLVIGSNS
ncbi:putative defense protein 1 [Amblyraja radiata]|uniref:putative defense protein 1 n=1 Tax=Amblyraja radiata TaxID=386614 RepID=UPI001401EEAD|nr:putative defense protein 1 [Amblyraja radiata]